MDCIIGFKEIGYKDFLSVVSTFLDLDSATEKTAGSETRLTFWSLFIAWTVTIKSLPYMIGVVFMWNTVLLSAVFTLYGEP